MTSVIFIKEFEPWKGWSKQVLNLNEIHWMNNQMRNFHIRLQQGHADAVSGE